MIHNRGVPFVSVNLGSSTAVSALDVHGRMISPYGANAFGSKFWAGSLIAVCVVMVVGPFAPLRGSLSPQTSHGNIE
jgi:hypothetical protein